MKIRREAVTPPTSHARGATAMIVFLLVTGCTRSASDPSTRSSTPSETGIAASTAPTFEPTPGEHRAPTDVGALAYARDGDIYVAGWDGGDPVLIADGRPANACGGVPEYWADGPIWSPDGAYLAYRHTDCDAYHANSWDVVISDPEGNVVASFPSAGWRIAWSPDSSRVAVWVEFEKTIGIYAVHSDRRALLTLPRGMMASGDNDPEWSPDGESVLVPNAVEIPLDGSPPRRLPWDKSGPARYSPDGSHIVYYKHRKLVVAEADGSNPQKVPSSHRSRPIWSSSGDRIAFTASTGHQLRVFDVTTGAVTLAAAAESDTTFLYAIDLSPSGDWVLFSKTEFEGRPSTSLWSVNADGSDPRLLIDGVDWAVADWQSLSREPARSTAPSEPHPAVAFRPHVDPQTDLFANLGGWIAYRSGRVIMAVDPADPATKVSLGSVHDCPYEHYVDGCGNADPVGWSPDGSELLVSIQGDVAPSALYVLRDDGSGIRLAKEVGWGSFSPDGNKVAYACCGSWPGPRVIGVNGGGARSLGDPCDTETLICGEPLLESAAWSPDGSAIAWIDFVEYSLTYGHHAFVLSFVHPDGTHLREEVAKVPGGAGLIWSPDGSQLAFWVSDDDRPGQIFVINADGTGLKRLTHQGDNRWPVWSPDGSRLAFVHNGALYTIAPDGTDARSVANVQPEGAIAWNAAP